MPWRDEILTSVRILSGDFACELYSDDRLEQTIIVAAKIMTQEIDFAVDYAISVENLSISPDPVDTGDLAFENLLILKTVCTIDQFTLRTKAALSNVKAVLGPASLQVGDNLVGYVKILEAGVCATYAKLRNDMIWGNIGVVKAVLSPFSSNKFDPRYLNYGVVNSDKNFRD